MAKIFVMCGIPASGKTTLANQLSHKYESVVYSYDELRKNRLSKCMPTRPYFTNLIRQSLINNQNVIVDDLYTTKESRHKLLSDISDIACEKILIVLQTPLETCIERDKTRTSHNLCRGVICNFNKRYEQPTLDEGWDKILYY